MIVQLLLIAALLYLAWALLHHRRDKSLTLAVYIEYLLTAILVLIITTGVVFS